MAAVPRTFEEAFGTPEREELEDQDWQDDENQDNRDINIDYNNDNNDIINRINNVSLESIEDNIISPSTCKSYVSGLMQFLTWVIANENQWLTQYGNEQLASILVQRENETVRNFRVRRTREFKTLLRNSPTEPIVYIDRITPPRYISFILTLRRNNTFLSKSSYGCKRAALYHLFLKHNQVGFSEAFRKQLSNLYKGLYRQVASRRVVRGNNNGIEINLKEGKELMSVELYKLLCELFLKHGTSDGMFGHCYLVLTWNLACRCNNTSRIKFAEIQWSQTFDSFSILFAQTKTDQLGEDAKKPRHIYSNPLHPLVCPVLALAMYLTTCFENDVVPNSALFPGESQDARFSNILQKVVNDNWNMISRLGYKRGEIGTHSIRKGASSYLSSIPGGPDSGSISNRAGWSQGRVKDIYIRYVPSGDQFVGRCLSLLPLLATDFASSPPYFVDDTVDWIEPLRQQHFRSVALVPGMGKLTCMCLASIIHHYDWLQNILGVNHVFLLSSLVHRNVITNNQRESVGVTYPWNDTIHHFSGIPPHVAILQDMAILKHTQEQLIQDQRQMVDQYTTRTRELLEELNLDGGRRAEQQNFRNMLDEFRRDFRLEYANATAVLPQNQRQIGDTLVPEVNREENGTIYLLHFYLGSYKRVPREWRFPRLSVSNMWRQWWIGNTVTNVPPLRHLQLSDVKHLDDIELGEEELHGRKGRYKLQRRKSTKILSDMKFLMEYVTRKVRERNAFRAEITIATVDSMFDAVADLLSSNARNAQLNWLTAVGRLRTEHRNAARSARVVDEDVG